MPKINIKGSILTTGSEWLREYGYEVVTPRDVTEVLEQANGEDVEIIINSPGGYTSSASEMYTAIKGYKGNVTAKIVGYACSAASWVALGASKIEISPTGLMMIHNSSTYTGGDYREMDKSSDMLQAVDKSIRNALKIKTNKTDEEIKKLMDKETWFTAEEALQNKLVDEIMFSDEPTNFSINDLQMPNSQILNMIFSKNKKEEEENMGEKKVANEKTQNVTVEAIKNNFKDIYDEILKEGAEKERKRIRDIEEVEVKGFEELTNKAKFEETISASEYAMNVLREQKKIGNKFLENIAKDKNDITVQPAINEDNEEERNALINTIVNAANANK